MAEGTKRIEQLAPELDRIIEISQSIQELADGFGGPQGPAEGGARCSRERWHSAQPNTAQGFSGFKRLRGKLILCRLQFPLHAGVLRDD